MELLVKNYIIHEDPGQKTKPIRVEKSNTLQNIYLAPPTAIKHR